MTRIDAGPAYARLEARFARINALAEAEGMLHWDLATMMPKGGAASRSDQLAVLRALRHGLLTAPEVGDLLAHAANKTVARSISSAANRPNR